MSEALSSPGGERVTLDRVLGFDLVELGAESARAKAEENAPEVRKLGTSLDEVIALLADELKAPEVLAHG